MTPSTAQRIADNIRAAMGLTGVTAAQLSGALNLSSSATHRRLSGQVEFRPSELAAIADMLNTSARELMPAAAVA